MNRSYLLPIAIAAVFVAGCAAMDQKSAEPQPEKDYVTGSRLPARDHGSSSAVKGIESKEGIDDMMRQGNVAAPAKVGK
jgi:hypothetical protein